MASCCTPARAVANAQCPVWPFNPLQASQGDFTAISFLGAAERGVLRVCRKKCSHLQFLRVPCLRSWHLHLRPNFESHSITHPTPHPINYKFCAYIPSSHPLSSSPLTLQLLPQQPGQALCRYFCPSQPVFHTAARVISQEF